MGTSYYEPKDFEFIQEIDGRVLTDKRLSPAEKVVLLRFYASEIATVHETTEETAKILGMRINTVGTAKRNLVKKGFLQVFENDGRGKTYRPLFHKVRGNSKIENKGW